MIALRISQSPSFQFRDVEVEEECRNNMLITRYGLIAEMLRLMIEFRNSVKKTKDGLFHRISLKAITSTGINSDQKYSNSLKMAQNFG